VLLPFLAAYGNTQMRVTVTHRATALYATLPGGGDNQKLETMRAIGGLPALPRLAIEPARITGDLDAAIAAPSTAWSAH